MAKKKESEPLQLYSKMQQELIEKHIEKNFGEIENYFRETKPENIRIDIYVVPPTPEKCYYTLVTVGMGAHIQNVPEDYVPDNLERAELVLCLPPSWDPEGETSDDIMPLHLLKMLAKLPIKENAWLGWGHSVDYGQELSENSPFTGVVLVNSRFGEESRKCDLGCCNIVNFYQVVPLYPQEIAFKNEYGARALISRFAPDQLKIVDMDRSAVVPKNFAELIDSFDDHVCKIHDKNLDCFDINAANHIAAYLKWCIAHKMINDEFKEYFAEEFAQIRKGSYDARKFIINMLGGELTTEILTEEGKAFAKYYYDFYDDMCYPGDVDDMALGYFGKEKYNCEEFCDEAYLFVPYGEEYLKAMNKYINRAYRRFKAQAQNTT